MSAGLPCFDCGLPDLHNGAGDGIGSCECPRCETCGAPPGCDCSRLGEDCRCGECGGWDEFGGWDDDWTPELRPIETIDTGGLL